MTREQAIKLVEENIKNQNLRRHCLSVEATMRSLAKHFGESEDEWGLSGLLHDADYEIVKDDAKRHTRLTLEWLSKHEVSQEVKNAILAHGWGYVEGNPQPSNNMEWSIYCCDELTGLIVAVALTRPSKKLADVTVEAVRKKWKEKSFAAGVDREQIAKCEEKLKIKLDDFIGIAIGAMQGIHEELGL